jgi:hypothetical protein
MICYHFITKKTAGMTIFTLSNVTKRKSLLFTFKSCILFSFFAVGAMSSKAQVTDIYTDYNGFWHSSTSAFSPILPTKSHNVVGFTFGGITYSTGVNNSLLTTQGIPYTSGKYKTLPFTSIAGTNPKGSDIYIALSEQIDGVPNGFSNPLPTVKIKEALTDGVNGLNIGTGVTNLPSSAGMTFPAQIISISAISDNQPDVIYAQMTDAASSADVLLFQDSLGHTVGKSNSIQWNLIQALGNYSVDYYNLAAGALLDTASIVSGNTSNSTQSMRLAAFKLSDFGITSANASQVKTFVIKPAGSSDPAFIAYNTDGIYIIPPIITSQPQSQVVCSGSGQSATFSVNATGIQLSYQWMKDGMYIPGATSATYTIPTVTASDAGSYQVVITNAGGTQYSDIAYLNSTITRQPSPVSQTIVTGNNITYSVSATNVTSFQWKKNGVDIPGATDSIYKINPVTTADAGSYTVAVINSASNGCASMLSNAASLTPAIVVYSKSSPDINVPSTWGANTDGSGSTPVDFTRAEHTFVLSNRPSGNTLTDLTIAGTLDVKDGIAIIADNTTLDVGHLIRTGTGSVTGSSAAGLTVRGNSSVYFTPGYQLLKNFTITGGTVSMLSPLRITGGTLPGKLNLTGGTLALGSNVITLASTSVSNTSMVTQVGATASITYGSGGGFLVERFIPAKRSFRFISPAVTTTTNIKTNWMEGVVNPDRWNNINPLPGYGTHITGPHTPADSLDPTQTFNPSLFVFDKNTQGWSTIGNSSRTLTAGSPYRLMVRGSRAVDLNDNEATPSNTILRATGVITTGTVDVTSQLSTKLGGYSFVGNPYASPIDWNSLTKSSISSTYYTWDEHFNKRGAYVSYNGAAQTNSNPLSSVDQNIQSQQAFLIQTIASNPSLQFKESNKTTSNTAVFRGANSAMPKLSVQLLLNEAGGSENTADGTVAVYDNNFSEAVGDEDSYKFTNLDENIAINRKGTLLSIEGRPLVTRNDTLPLKMWQFRQNNYWIKITGSNFNEGVEASIKDQYLNKTYPIDLTSSTTVPFQITADAASSAANRFSITFDASAALPVILTNVKAYQKNKGIQVEWNTETEINVDKYEIEKSVDGQQFAKANTVASKGSSGGGYSYDWLDTNVSDGNNFYRIKVIEKSGAVKYSEVVRVNISSRGSSVSIYPNPVKGGLISMQLTNMQQGRYEVNIFSSTGQKVYQTAFDHKGGSSLETIALPRKISAGSYSLQISNNSTTIVEKLLVQ